MPGAEDGVANILGILSVERHFLQRKAGRFESPVIQKVRTAIGWMLELQS